MSKTRRFTAPEVTGGGGFRFEDEVVAFYLLSMLDGAGPDGMRQTPDGRIVRIACQQGQLGWHPDDVVLTLEDCLGSRRCAVSLKSYAALSGKGFVDKPAEPHNGAGVFAEQAWRLHLGDCLVDPPFDPERDLICLVGNGIAATHRGTWQFISERATKQDPATFRDAGLSKQQAKMFDGLACPPTVRASLAADTVATARFVRSLRVYDFAEYRGRALVIGQNLLLSGDRSEAEKLWDACCRIASRYRPEAGVLDLPTALAELRGSFALKPYPDHTPDLDALARVSSSIMGDIQDTIDGFSLPREAECTRITSAFSDPAVRAVVVIGVPGSGKTVVAKRWAASATSASARIVWWDNATLAATGTTAFAAGLGLKHELQELFSATPESQAFLIIDNIDHIFGEEQALHLRALLKAARVYEHGSPWRVLFTCETQAWADGEALWKDLISPGDKKLRDFKQWTEFRCQQVGVSTCHRGQHSSQRH
jgi:hypothetical protein